MARLILYPTRLGGVRLIERQPLGDERGWFERLFCEEELRPVLGARRIHQVNRSFTVRRGAVRGLHFQHPPAAEVKIVSCLRGQVFDVAVDLRAGSDTFLQWHGVRLSADNRRSLLIPEGFAHGFQTLTEDCELLYLHTAAYDAEREDGFDALDSRIGVGWPLPVSHRSPRDEGLPDVPEDFGGIAL